MPVFSSPYSTNERTYLCHKLTFAVNKPSNVVEAIVIVEYVRQKTGLKTANKRTHNRLIMRFHI